MSEPSKQPSALTVLGTVAGVLAGILGTYWKLEDEMEEEIRQRVLIETRLSAVETQAKVNKDAIWTMQIQQQPSGQ